MSIDTDAVHKRRARRLRLLRAVAGPLAGAAITLGGCASLGDQQLEPVSRRDAVLTTDVKGALIASPQVSAASIRVQLEAQTLVLSGFVDDERERLEAGRIARRAATGLTIDNRLEVR